MHMLHVVNTHIYHTRTYNYTIDNTTHFPYSEIVGQYRKLFFSEGPAPCLFTRKINYTFIYENELAFEPS